MQIKYTQQQNGPAGKLYCSEVKSAVQIILVQQENCSHSRKDGQFNNHPGEATAY